jgi:hypothetical protein
VGGDMGGGCEEFIQKVRKISGQSTYRHILIVVILEDAFKFPTNISLFAKDKYVRLSGRVASCYKFRKNNTSLFTVHGIGAPSRP